MPLLLRSAANAVENELPIPEFLDSPIIGLAEMKIPALGEALEGDDDLPQPNNAYLFDINHLVTEMGIDMWNFSGWRSSKAIAEVLLLWLRNVNSMALVTSSMALVAIKSLITLFSMFDDKSRQFYMAVSGSKRKAKSFKDDEYFNSYYVNL
nr:Nucleoporin like [Ipomoea batatas]